MAYQLLCHLWDRYNTSADVLRRHEDRYLTDTYTGFPNPWLRPSSNWRFAEVKPAPIGSGGTELRLGYSRICDEAVYHLVRFLATNSNVTGLDLQHNEVTDVGARDIAKMLRANRGVLELNLSSNLIENAGAVEIARSIPDNSTLQVLTLNGNLFSTPGAVCLLTALQLNRTLRRLALSHLGLGPEVAQQLVASLRGSSQMALEHLELQKNSLGDEGGREFAALLADPHVTHRLRTLNLAYNGMSDGAGMVFAEAFGRPTTVEAVDLYGNDFTDRVALALCLRIAPTSRLAFLSVGGALLSNEGQAMLVEFETHHNAIVQTMATADPTGASPTLLHIHTHDARLALPGLRPVCPLGHLLLATCAPHVGTGFGGVAGAAGPKVVSCFACGGVLRMPLQAVFWCGACEWGLCYTCARADAEAQRAAAAERDLFWERYKYARDDHDGEAPSGPSGAAVSSG
eukprot:TRINITY_DN7337_c0_g1_i1.p1 TRINITY_DN7337_c0_g1~~TRINITY_DN7337_c0_g1_i1.p1  ORF type:complete len:458 (+),score=60.55 TRINITY_DN7337_c0_g1_i1:101-1474(+)